MTLSKEAPREQRNTVLATVTALHLRQKSIISSGLAIASACARAVGALHTDSQCLPVSELLIISTLATAKLRAEAEAEAEADSEHFDTFGTLQTVLLPPDLTRLITPDRLRSFCG
jgi:hypothetical protein